MADIDVHDEASTNDTVPAARGNAVRPVFADTDAGLFVLVGGDGTHPADRIPRMTEVHRNRDRQ